MKRTLLGLLCCPTCKGPLSLSATKEEAGEVVSGSLVCDACSVTYPIEDGIPDLLPRESHP